jgi:large subunit ribosomal protein L7/L12
MTATKTKKSHTETVIEAIESMTVLELSDLVNQLQEKFGVTAAAPVVQAAAGPAAEAAAAPEEEKTEFTVTLKSFGDKKIQVIKEIRAITGLGLKEAKALVDGVPKPVKEAIGKEEAEKIKNQLEAAGATAEIT